jgi:hypothetical protein
MLVARPVSSNTGVARPGGVVRPFGEDNLRCSLGSHLDSLGYVSPHAGRHRRDPKAPRPRVAAHFFSPPLSFLSCPAAPPAYYGRVIPFLRRLVAALGLAALLCHCSSTSSPDSGKPDTAQDDPVAVGIIEFVNPEQKFVLIKMQSRMPMPPGHKLTALDATGALSELVVSPERKGTHLTADIVSGNPRRGNLIIHQPALNRPAGSAPNPSTAPLIPPGNASPSPSGSDVEWRDGQPPPLPTPGLPGATPLPAPASPAAPPVPMIPLDPLPEEPVRPSP